MYLKLPQKQSNPQNIIYSTYQPYNNPYNQQHSPKKHAKQTVLYLNNNNNTNTNNNKITSKNICSRCNIQIQQQQKIIKCIDCNNMIYCQNCNMKIHKIGKFYIHRRSYIHQHNNNKYNGNDISSLSNVSILDRQFSQNIVGNTNTNTNIQTDRYVDKGNGNHNDNDNDNNSQSLIKMTIINISQNWDSIIFEISQKFKQIITLLKDKRKQIIQKIQRKRQQQIKYCQDSIKIISTQNINLNTNINTNTNKNQGYVNKKLRRLSTQDIQTTLYNIKLTLPTQQQQQQKLQKSYKVSLNIFEQLNNLINKLQIKNILTKILDQPKQTSNSSTIKKPMKSSLIISTSSSSALSPYTKTPTHTKAQLSQSTVQIQGNNQYNIDKFSKIILETKKKNLQLKLKEQPTLHKVRSQKLIFKSPTNKNNDNINRNINNKQKTMSKKGFKLGQ